MKRGVRKSKTVIQGVRKYSDGELIATDLKIGRLDWLDVHTWFPYDRLSRFNESFIC